MALLGLVVLLGVVVVVPAFAVALVLWWAGRRAADTEVGAARQARRHELLIALGAALAASGAAIGVMSLPVAWTSDYVPTPRTPGLMMTLGPFLVAVVFLGVRAVGELTWPRPAGAVRTARLRRRTVRTLGGRRLRWLGATSLLLVGAVVVFGATAGPTGRAFETSGQLDPGTPGGVVGSYTSAAGPYPGWPYGVPLLVGLLLALLGTAATLALVARRTPLPGVPPAHDEAVRTTSAARILGGVQLCVGGACGLVLLVAGGAILRVERDGAALVVAGGGSVLAGLVVGIASVAAAVISVVPRRGDRAPSEVTPAPLAGQQGRS
ncbi:hypothetical protein [Nocardioides limicola]|uniref:hypothetical protein n=1 Tax=Nocardioides limicola TaxID=2803368 RepID=UPI00193C8169|nr:hypothetical protein [Nocardioides sp. DJM-14]